MDLCLEDHQSELAELAGRILDDACTPERLRQIEADPAWFARAAWRELAKADLLGLCLPEADGGGGYGMVEAGLLSNVMTESRVDTPAASALEEREPAMGQPA